MIRELYTSGYTNRTFHQITKHVTLLTVESSHWVSSSPARFIIQYVKVAKMQKARVIQAKANLSAREPDECFIWASEMQEQTVF